MSTDVTNLIAELDAGVFEQKASTILSQVGAAVVDNKRPGRVTIQLDFKHIGDSSQLSVVQKIAYQRPTMNGKLAEEDATEGVLYVGTGGALSTVPETQMEIDGLTRQSKQPA